MLKHFHAGLSCKRGSITHHVHEVMNLPAVEIKYVGPTTPATMAA